MRQSLPIILCSANEDYRLLLREMLGKNGFFHVLEASSKDEVSELLQMQTQDSFTIIQNELIDEEISKILKHRKQFLILTQSGNVSEATRAVVFGVNHFLSFPFSSTKLMQKIQSLA